MQQELKIIVKADGTATVTRQLDSVNNSISKVETNRNKLAGGKDMLRGMATGALTAAAAYLSFRAAINTANQALNNFTDAFTALNEVQATLNSTGRTAEFTAEQLAGMATELEQVSAIGDEEILRGATIGLLRFDAISKEMFPRVQKLAVDMAKSMGGIENATKTLGISIADPVLGMTRLRRAGVMLDQSQQDLIKSFVDAGQTAEAQGVLISALESKYGGLAQAGVTGAALLKVAWQDYLEVVGGSLSAFDGVKRGLAQFFFGIANDSDNLSKSQMMHLIDVQEQWAKTTLNITERGKQAITIMGGFAVSSVGILQDTMNGIRQSFTNIYGAFVNMYNGLGQIAPRLMEAITGVSSFKDALNDLKDDFSSYNKGMTGIDAFGTESQKNIKNWIATFSNANSSIKEGEAALTDFYEAQRKLVESGKNPFTGVDMAEGEDASGLLAAIDQNEALAIGRLRDVHGDMLSAWATYYSTVDQYSNESIRAQADLYKYQLEQQYGNVLSMGQIDQMYNDKLWDLRDAQINHWKDTGKIQVGDNDTQTTDMLSAWIAYYAAIDQYSDASIQRQAELYKLQIQEQYGAVLTMQQIDEMYYANLQRLQDEQLDHYREVEKETLENNRTTYQEMQDYMREMATTVQDQAFNVLENALYSLMAETKSLRDVWHSAMSAIRDIAMRMLADIITQTIRAIAVQMILKALLGVGTSSIGWKPPTGVWTQPIPGVPPSPLNSVSGGGLNSLPTGGNANSELLSAIRDLRNDRNNEQTPTFNLFVDGKELHHSIERAKTKLNYMGSGA